MATILNEVNEALNILKSGEVGNKPSSTLFLLIRYYRQKENLSNEDTFTKINDFMSKNYKGYNSALWEDIIEDDYKKANKYPLREIESVGITQSELDKIQEIENIKYQKLVFAMLCYAKLYNSISENNNGWVNTKIKEIYKTARVIVKHSEDKFLYLNDLEKLGLISFSNKNDNLNLRITFIDENNDYALKVCDFRELGYEYLNYIGEGNFIRCSECGRLVRKTNNKIKYCNECAKKITIKNWKRASKKYYHKIENAEIH